MQQAGARGPAAAAGINNTRTHARVHARMHVRTHAQSGRDAGSFEGSPELGIWRTSIHEPRARAGERACGGELALQRGRGGRRREQQQQQPHGAPPPGPWQHHLRGAHQG